MIIPDRKVSFTSICWFNWRWMFSFPVNLWSRGMTFYRMTVHEFLNDQPNVGYQRDCSCNQRLLSAINHSLRGNVVHWSTITFDNRQASWIISISDAWPCNISTAQSDICQ
jgi:hypothetical protein